MRESAVGCLSRSVSSRWVATLDMRISSRSTETPDELAELLAVTWRESTSRFSSFSTGSVALSTVSRLAESGAKRSGVASISPSSTLRSSKFIVAQCVRRIGTRSTDWVYGGRTRGSCGCPDTSERLANLVLMKSNGCRWSSSPGSRTAKQGALVHVE